MVENRVEARQSLEAVFIRGRWLAGLVILLLMVFGAAEALAGTLLLIALAITNVLVRHFNTAVKSLKGQRCLGFAATAADSGALLALAAIASADLVPSIYAVLIIAVGEISLRYTPMKAAIGWASLVAGLAAVMAIRDAAGHEQFDFRLLALWTVLILVVGAIVGLATREIYRQRVASPLESQVASDHQIDADLLKRLSPRERQVLNLIVQGHSNQQIAETLVIEPKTVKNHINSVYSKLQLSSRYEAIATVLGQRRGQ